MPSADRDGQTCGASARPGSSGGPVARGRGRRRRGGRAQPERPVDGEPDLRRGEEGIDLFNAAAAPATTVSPSCPRPAGQPGPAGHRPRRRGALRPVDQRPHLRPGPDRDLGLLRPGQRPGRWPSPSATARSRSSSSPSRPRPCRPRWARAPCRPGIIAGLIGLAAVFAYLFLYYRLLAVVTLASLSTSAAAAVGGDVLAGGHRDPGRRGGPRRVHRCGHRLERRELRGHQGGRARRGHGAVGGRAVHDPRRTPPSSRPTPPR